MANAITLIRVLIALLVLAIIQINPILNIVAILLIIISMLLDAVDGYIARHYKTASLSGSVYDILADRIIENIFFIYFAAFSLFNIWFSLIMMIRGLVIDAIRTLYVREGKTAFGKNTLHSKRWARVVACSRMSRGSYNVLKMLTFISYTALLMPNNVIFDFINFNKLQTFALLCLWGTFLLALLRAVPVLIDGWALYKKVTV